MPYYRSPGAALRLLFAAALLAWPAVCLAAAAPDPNAGHAAGVSALAYSPDGKLLAAGCTDGRVLIEDAAGAGPIHGLAGHTSGVTCAAFSPDGRFLATGSWDKTVILWDVPGMRRLRTLSGHSDQVTAVAFSPDGKTLASASWDHKAILWDPQTGLPRRTLDAGPTWLTSAAFSPDGKTLALGAYDNTVTLWDPATGEKRRTLAGHHEPVISIAFSPDGKTLASGSWDRTIILWDTATGEKRSTLQGHKHVVSCLAFSPDSKTLASGSSDKSVILWDVATGQAQRTLTGHTWWVKSVAFSPDGKTLASGAWDKLVIRWNTANGEAAQQHINLPGEGPATLAVAVETPEDKDVAAWGAMSKDLAQDWYPRIVEILGDEMPDPRPAIKVLYKEMDGVAYTAGPQITVSIAWIRRVPDDRGMIVHELTHVVQHYRRPAPGWLVEGIADYVRWWCYEPRADGVKVDLSKASYRDAYRTTAAFLAYVEQHWPGTVAKAHHAARSGEYKDALFQEWTGKSLDDLWSEFVKARIAAAGQ